MQMPFPLCLIGRHQVSRSSMKWDGLNYVGRCRHCGTRLRRKSHKVWLPDWLADETPK